MTTGGRPSSATRHSPLGDIHVKDIWAVLVRHWFLVLLITGLVAGGAWYTGRDAIPLYRSVLTLQVSSSKTAFGRTNDIDVDPVALQTDPVLSEALVLTTQELARSVVHQLALQVQIDDPAISRQNVFAMIEVDSGAPLATYDVVRKDSAEGWDFMDVAGSLLTSGAYGQRLEGTGFRFTVLPPAQSPEVIRFHIVHLDQAARWVRSGLGYQVRTATTAFDVSFIGTDPSLVPLVLSEAATQLQTDGVTRLRRTVERRREFIEGAIDSTEEGLSFVLDTIQRFKETRQVTDLSAEEGALFQTIAAFERDRMRLRVQISTLEAAITETGAASLQALNRLAAVDAVQSNAALAFQINRLLNMYEERRGLTAGSFGLRPDNPQVLTLSAEIDKGHIALNEAAGAARFSGQVAQVRIMTPDKDLGQCLRGERVVQIDRMRGKSIDEKRLIELRGVAPRSIPDWLALVGDSADGIPGIRGFGAKSAAAVLAHYECIEAIPADAADWEVSVRGAARLAGNLSERREDALLYKRLATLDEDAALPGTRCLADLEWQGVPREAFRDWCGAMRADRLRDRPRRWAR